MTAVRCKSSSDIANTNTKDLHHAYVNIDTFSSLYLLSMPPFPSGFKELTPLYYFHLVYTLDALGP